MITSIVFNTVLNMPIPCYSSRYPCMINTFGMKNSLITLFIAIATITSLIKASLRRNSFFKGIIIGRHGYRLVTITIVRDIQSSKRRDTATTLQ